MPCHFNCCLDTVRCFLELQPITVTTAGHLHRDLTCSACVTMGTLSDRRARWLRWQYHVQPAFRWRSRSLGGVCMFADKPKWKVIQKQIIKWCKVQNYQVMQSAKIIALAKELHNPVFHRRYNPRVWVGRIGGFELLPGTVKSTMIGLKLIVHLNFLCSLIASSSSFSKALPSDTNFVAPAVSMLNST